MKTLLAVLLLLVLAGATFFWLVREGPAPSEAAVPGRPSTAPSEPAAGGEALELATPASFLRDAPASDERREASARSFDPGLARRVSGRVEIPAGTPSDELLEVAAVEREEAPRSLSEAWDDFPASELVARAEVGSSGAFELTLPPDAKQTWIVLRSRYLRLAEAVEVPAGNAAPVLQPELGAWITGRIVLPAGAGAADPDDFTLELVPDPRSALSGGGMMSRPRESRRSGDLTDELDFEWGGVLAGIPLDLRVRPEHFAAHKSGRLELRPGEHRELTIALAHGGTLAGSVRDERGAPVEGVELEVEIDPVMMGRGGYEVRSGKTGADGTFKLEAVTPGKLKLLLERDGMLDDSFDVELAEGEQRADLALVLSLGSSISGRLTWPDGSPVSGGKVNVDFDPAALSGMGAFNAMRGGRGEGVSDEQGVFAVHGLGKGPFLVRGSIERDGETWRARKSPVAPDTSGVELQLRSPITIEGSVVDDAGTPVKAFKVHAATKSIGFMRGIGADTADKEFEDEQGHFRLSGLSSGSWTITASSKGYARGVDLDLELPTVGPIELRVPRAALVRGTVVGPDGQPVAGATVEPEVGLEDLIERQTGDGGPRAVSDDQGRFELGGLTPGALSIAARKEGFAKSLPAALDIESSAVTEGVELALRLGGRITGEIYGKDGKPYAGATILAQQPTDLGNQRFGTSDSAGLFVFESVTPGSWQVLTLPGGGSTNTMSGDNFAELFAEMKMQTAEVVEGEEVHVVLGALPANPVRVSGHVRVDGSPVPNVLVSFVLDGSKGMTDFKFTSAGPDGAYATDLNKPGSYLVQVQHLSGGPGQQQNVQINAEVPDQREFRLDLDLPVGAIVGRVRGPDGQPLAGARVTLSADGPISNRTFMGGNYAEIATDQDGYYELTWLRPGSYSVAAGGTLMGGMFGDAGGDAPGRQVQDDVKVREGERVEGVDFRLRAPGRLKGVVVDAAGNPVKDAAVFLRDGNGRPVERFAMVASDAAGRFSYSGIAPGEYSLSLRNTTLVSPSDVAVTIREGEESSVELGLGPGTILHVLLSDEDGNPVDCAVSVRDAAGRQVNGVWSLAELIAMMQSGEFSSKEQRVGPLPPGEYQVEAIAVDGRRASKPVQLNGQPERKLNLRVKD